MWCLDIVRIIRVPSNTSRRNWNGAPSSVISKEEEEVGGIYVVVVWDCVRPFILHSPPASPASAAAGIIIGVTGNGAYRIDRFLTNGRFTPTLAVFSVRGAVVSRVQSSTHKNLVCVCVSVCE